MLGKRRYAPKLPRKRITPAANIRGTRKLEPAVTGTTGVGVAAAGLGVQLGPKVGKGVAWAKTE